MDEVRSDLELAAATLAGPEVQPVLSEVQPALPQERQVEAQCGGDSACGCGKGGEKADEPPQWVYALGNVDIRFPNRGVEHEFMELARRAGASGNDNKVKAEILNRPENKYLLRQVCFVFRIEGIDTYVLRPRDPGDFALLAETARQSPAQEDLDLIIGQRGPLVPPGYCNGLQVPLVVVDQVYSFTRTAILDNIAKPAALEAKSFTTLKSNFPSVFDRLAQMSDNAGATDEHRALNWLAVRYEPVYLQAAQLYDEGNAFEGAYARPSAVQGARKIYEVVLRFRSRQTDVPESWFVRVDVTDEFPFLVSKLQRLYQN